LLSYPWPVELVRELRAFWGRYAIYSTFPEGWTQKLLDKILEEGLYNISGGVDVWPGLLTGDKHVDAKSSAVLRWLVYCKEHGVPDVQATVTIHRHNFDKLYPLLDLCTEKDIWMGASLIEYSKDGKHDFYGPKESVQNWLIPESDRARFRDTMYELAREIRKGRWMMQVPPRYFERMGDWEYNQTPWHCSEAVLIHIEEDGMLRACSYRGPLKEPISVFELREGGSLSMEEYVRLQRQCADECPGCGGGGGAWSYWWMAEEFLKGRLDLGDKVFQTHYPGYAFEKESAR